MTKESNGSFIGCSPEFSLSKVERIVESNNWVQLFGKNLKVGLRLANLGGGASSVGNTWCGEGGGRSGKAEEGCGGEFHLDLLLVFMTTKY